MKCVFDKNGNMFLVCGDSVSHPSGMDYIIVPENFNITKKIIDKGKEVQIEVNKEELEKRLEKYFSNYVNARKIAYPSIEDQLDLIYHKGIDSWKYMISKIKDEFPKNQESITES